MANQSTKKLVTKEYEELIKNVPPSTSMKKNGSLTFVGSGIQAVGHFTVESLKHIKSCDKVFYCVADSLTSSYIKKIRPDSNDLYLLYDDDKERYTTYVQMSEVMLREARKGYNVVGIFYGHPGVFVLPSHRAIKIAKNEGIATKMLAAPSAADCLFADLEVDPSYPGCQSFEATDLLLRKRAVATDLHVIIWQVGCVGNVGFSFGGFQSNKKNLQILISYLQKFYGEHYEIINYIGSQFCVCEATKEKIKLSDFSNDEICKKITGMSTFYLPPMKELPVDETMAKQLGLVSLAGQPVVHGYGEQESTAINSMETWSVPSNYKIPHESEFSSFLIKLSEDSNAVKDIKLSKEQETAIANKDADTIRRLVSSNGDPNNFVVVVVVVVV